MDEDKILIGADLGKCDHETRNLLGSLLVVDLEQAALSRQHSGGTAQPLVLRFG